MTSNVSIAPPNGLLFISDRSGGVSPEFSEDKSVLSTDTVVSIACLPNVDGETQVALGPAAEIKPLAMLIFDGVLKTPTRTLMVETSERETILADAVPAVETRVRIWVNRVRDPDDIAVAWGS